MVTEWYAKRWEREVEGLEAGDKVYYKNLGTIYSYIKKSVERLRISKKSCNFAGS